MSGSVFAIFSDIVGQNQLYTTLAVNGEVYDFGGQVAYLNSKHKINWAVSLSHIPYLYVQYTPVYTNINNSLVQTGDYYDYIRLFQDQVSLIGFLPVSRVRRFELGTSSAWYYYRTDRESYITDSTGYTIYKKEKIASPSGFYVHSVNAAYVGDNSFFGMTAPMRGYRYRFGVEKYFGDASFYGLNLDYRQYLYQNPLTFAMRLYHYGRYGKSSDFLSPLYLGYPWWIRGYEASNIQQYQTQHNDSIFSINNLSGNRIAVANFEIRLPFTGPKKIALIKSNILLTDLSLFADIGLAWDNNNQLALKWKPRTTNERTPVISTGASLRVNVLGAMVLEPYYAFPLQFGAFKNPVFGVNFLPGW